VVYNHEFSDFWGMAMSADLLDFSNTAFNVLLTNNLNKYHPLIFYLSVITLIGASFVSATQANITARFSAAWFLKNLHRSAMVCVALNLLALYLGS